MNHRDWYLEQLGITQYTVRRPASLMGEVAITLTPEIRLLTVSAESTEEKIFDDILKAIRLTRQNVLTLKPEQLIMLPEQFNAVVWFINQPLPESWPAGGSVNNRPTIKTLSLSALAKSPKDKRQLWQELCQYEHYFHTEQS